LKQLVQNFKTGVVYLEDVPIPALKDGCLLVRNMASLISAGTEGGTVRLGKMSLLGKARARPEQIKKVLQALRTEGILATFNAVNRTLDLPIPLGYSSAGIVEAVTDGARDLPEGTRVACGGSGIANHADYIVVPRNLCVPIPEDLDFSSAAFTTVGSIAMQSVRIADVRFGENVVVIGLGLVGLLTVQILKASGCNVLGIDISPERIAWIEKKSICPAAVRKSGNIIDKVLEFSDGFGADAVIITAAVDNNDPVTLAGEISRHKGRVVVVGRTEMNAPRETYLFKELEMRTSYAYGPGTGDNTYELEGYDYPIGYVRWTENRNMKLFVKLLSEKKIDVDRLVTHVVPFQNAPSAFDIINNPKENSIGVILQYDYISVKQESSPVEHVKTMASNARPSADKIRVGIIGAGSFATSVMVPILAKRKDVIIQSIASASGLKASALAKKYAIPIYTSEADKIIGASDTDCVFIFTRHGTHAQLAEQALLSGKHVFVEKPLALTEESLTRIIDAQKKSGKALMVGFNRRFSPLALKLKSFFNGRCQPMMIEFRGNVGYRPPEHWLHDPVDGGGLILGEASHYIDFCRWIIDSEITDVQAASIGPSNTSVIPEDNVAITLHFKDSSLATVLYLSNGAKGFNRERCELHAEGRSAVWEDFRRVTLVKDLGFAKNFRHSFFPKKGYREELDAFLKAISTGESLEMEWLTGQSDASLAAIKATRCIQKR
jgi:predicted dehydrogenase/threonine dehydrogenase-like Zn-dependent dehydrogenase